MKEVVLHQPAPSPPTDDWILFSEDVVVDKHSSLREARSRKVRRDIEIQRPSEVSPAPEDKMEKAISSAEKYIESRNKNKQINNSCSHLPIKISSDVAVRKTVSKPLRVQSSKRLPTPDLSDVEEDDFWSCCATSESSA